MAIYPPPQKIKPTTRKALTYNSMTGDMISDGSNYTRQEVAAMNPQAGLKFGGNTGGGGQGAISGLPKRPIAGGAGQGGGGRGGFGMGGGGGRHYDDRRERQPIDARITPPRASGLNEFYQKRQALEQGRGGALELNRNKEMDEKDAIASNMVQQQGQAELRGDLSTAAAYAAALEQGNAKTANANRTGTPAPVVQQPLISPVPSMVETMSPELQFIPQKTRLPQIPSLAEFAKGSQDTGTRDQMALVGEKGPEVVLMPAHSQVVPNHKLAPGLAEYAEGTISRNFDPAAEMIADREIISRYGRGSSTLAPRTAPATFTNAQGSAGPGGAMFTGQQGITGIEDFRQMAANRGNPLAGVPAEPGFKLDAISPQFTPLKATDIDIANWTQRTLDAKNRLQGSGSQSAPQTFNVQTPPVQVAQPVQQPAPAVEVVEDVNPEEDIAAFEAVIDPEREKHLLNKATYKNKDKLKKLAAMKKPPTNLDRLKIVAQMQKDAAKGAVKKTADTLTAPAVALKKWLESTPQ